MCQFVFLHYYWLWPYCSC